MVEQQIVEEKTTEECEIKELRNEEVRDNISEDNPGVEVVNNVMAASDPAMETNEGKSIAKL